MTLTDTRPARPATVSAALVLALVAATLDVLTVVLGWLTLQGQLDAIDELIGSRTRGGSDSDVDAMTSGYVIGVAFSSLVLFAFAASYLINGMLASAGKQPARVLLWVTAGLDLCYFGCSTVSSGMPTDAELSSGGTITGTEVADAIAQAQPAWIQLLQVPATVLWALSLLILVAVLAAPSSNRYFRPAPATPAYPPPVGP
ncbi:hypothetical protein AB0M47_03810 [Hamadaea sp. NPDC051192]|uniref:hypothetical protein n=1 Tax=Hamadaea sp. NPDC051192 TaxID=3154940 RepID=UPI0034207A56